MLGCTFPSCIIHSLDSGFSDPKFFSQEASLLWGKWKTGWEGPGVLESEFTGCVSWFSGIWIAPVWNWVYAVPGWQRTRSYRLREAVVGQILHHDTCGIMAPWRTMVYEGHTFDIWMLKKALSSHKASDLVRTDPGARLLGSKSKCHHSPAGWPRTSYFISLTPIFLLYKIG